MARIFVGSSVVSRYSRYALLFHLSLSLPLLSLLVSFLTLIGHRLGSWLWAVSPSDSLSSPCAFLSLSSPVHFAVPFFILDPCPCTKSLCPADTFPPHKGLLYDRAYASCPPSSFSHFCLTSPHFSSYAHHPCIYNASFLIAMIHSTTSSSPPFAHPSPTYTQTYTATLHSHIRTYTYYIVHYIIHNL